MDRRIRDFQRVGVVNRGEPALRFIRALREYNLECGVDLEVVAFYTDGDKNAPFVRQADRAIAIGPPMRNNATGTTNAYCDHDWMIDHLVRSGCDAVWPGWGFVSEDADFVERLEIAEICFLGPSCEAMRKLGDKIESKYLAQLCDVPMSAWYEIDSDDDSSTLFREAERIGFPLMVKASGGGGGRGIRRVTAQEQLPSSIEAVQLEVAKSFGQGGILMEACVDGARHIEVQLVVDSDGEATALGVRDCSIQRRNQKVIEEAPSPVLPASMQRLLCEASIRLAEKAGYEGVATAEYLYDVKSGQATFLEVNSRLQVEHTVTELIMGCDLVKAQIDIARGLPWDKPDPRPRGHAIEVRINAENTEKDFQPSPGMLTVFRPPSGPGVRVDSGVSQGMEIAPEFDSMIAKIIAWAPTRRQAIARLMRAVRELDVVVEDGTTNQAFLCQLLEHPVFVDGSADTTWLDRLVAEDGLDVPSWQFEALLAAAVLEYRRQAHHRVQRFFAQTQNGIPQNLGAPAGIEVDLRLRGGKHHLTVFEVSDGEYMIAVGSGMHAVEIEMSGPHAAQMKLGDQFHKILFSYGSAGIAVEVDGTHHTIERESGGVIRAQSPGMVVGVAVTEGDHIEVGARLCTLEAMKMEMDVISQDTGIIKSILCRPNQQVVVGQPLIVLDAEADGGTSTTAVTEYPEPAPRPMDLLFQTDGKPDPSGFDKMSAEKASTVWTDLMAELRSIMLGFDIPPIGHRRIDRLFGSEVDFRDLDHPERWVEIGELLAIFADCASLFDRNLLLVDGEAASETAHLAFYHFCRRHHEGADGAVAELLKPLERALSWYDVQDLEPSDPLRGALVRLATSHAHSDARHKLCSALLRVMMQLHEAGAPFGQDPDLADVLDRVAQTASARFPYVGDTALEAKYVLFEQERYMANTQISSTLLDETLADISEAEDPSVASNKWLRVSNYPHSLLDLVLQRASLDSPTASEVLQAIICRLYMVPPLEISEPHREGGQLSCRFEVQLDKNGDHPDPVVILGAMMARTEVVDFVSSLASKCTDVQVVEVILSDQPDDREKFVWATLLEKCSAPDEPLRLTLSWRDPSGAHGHRTFFAQKGTWVAQERLRNIHPEAARRIELWRLQEFELERLQAPEQLYAFRGIARENAKDERILICAEVRSGRDRSLDLEVDDLWEFEQVFFEAIRVLRQAQSQRTSVRNRFRWNRLAFYFRQPMKEVEARRIIRHALPFEPHTRGLSVQELVIYVRTVGDDQAVGKATEFVFRKPGRHRLEVETNCPPSHDALRPLTQYEMKVVRARRSGCIYPYEIARMLSAVESAGSSVPHPDMVGGHFQEFDLTEDRDRLAPVDRPYGQNVAGVVVGIVSNRTEKYPEGMRRVWIASDPTRAMGAAAEPECRRIIAAIDLADAEGLPVEWLPISAGAKISMDSGTENLDWTAAVLRRIVEFTQAGGQIHTLICGVNVGAQSYWNAEATMLMHTKGVLIMTQDASMVLTGKKALEFSGGVAAEDERGIGGYERIMGPNGQSQYYAKDLGEGYALLFEYYRCAYKPEGDRFPRRFATADPFDRSISEFPYRADDDKAFEFVGEIFDDRTNPDRKKPFAIRAVMRAVMDQDSSFLERFLGMRHGESAVIWDTHLGGIAVCMIGVESKPTRRRGRVPMDGPDTWTGGTLFPQSSKKVARALNSASGQRPVVVLANLSGFDGSPESLRKLQLESGAEIGRAVVNFQGPIIFVVIGRYHGGAYVVFSKRLNENLRSIALQGTFASVIGGAPAAAVVFPRDVRQRVERDPRVEGLRRDLRSCPQVDRPLLREQLERLLTDVTLEKQGEVAQEFDAIHTVERAVQVGSLDHIVAPARLRPAIIEELEQACAAMCAEDEKDNG
jgi:acetyl/propionyl-CoA carboxylase alpha subunit/acetyl-CoA carboxylase carboxyltransferase component